MIRVGAALVAICSASALFAEAEAETVTVKGQDYTYVPYELFEEWLPKGWFVFRHDRFPWTDTQVMIPFGVTFCDLLRAPYLDDRSKDDRAGREYIQITDPVGSFATDITRGYFSDTADMDQVKSAGAHCAAHSAATGNEGLGKDPLFFFYGTLRQDPYKDVFGEPWLELDGAIFSETYGQSAWFPSYGAKPPPMKLPKAE